MRQNMDTLTKERAALSKLEKECTDRVNQVCGKKALSASVECSSCLASLVARIDECSNVSELFEHDPDRLSSSTPVESDTEDPIQQVETCDLDIKNVAAMFKRYIQLFQSPKS